MDDAVEFKYQPGLGNAAADECMAVVVAAGGYDHADVYDPGARTSLGQCGGRTDDPATGEQSYVDGICDRDGGRYDQQCGMDRGQRACDGQLLGSRQSHDDGIWDDARGTLCIPIKEK